MGNVSGQRCAIALHPRCRDLHRGLLRSKLEGPVKARLMFEVRGDQRDAIGHHHLCRPVLARCSKAMFVLLLTFGNVDGVSGEACALPHQAALFGEEWWNLTADELVRDWLLGVSVELVRVL